MICFNDNSIFPLRPPSFPYITSILKTSNRKLGLKFYVQLSNLGYLVFSRAVCVFYQGYIPFIIIVWLNLSLNGWSLVYMCTQWLCTDGYLHTDNWTVWFVHQRWPLHIGYLHCDLISFLCSQTNWYNFFHFNDM